MQQKLFQNFFYNKKLELLEITEKEPQKRHPKLKKICILYIYREFLLCLQFNGSGSFLQTCINFVEQLLKFSHFKGSIIP